MPPDVPDAPLRSWHPLRSALDQPSTVDAPDADTRLAAVLLPLLDGPEPSLVFTKRAEDLSRHQGEISFPGGLQHREDGSLVETALRETEEEIGIPGSAVEVLGALEPVHTFVSGILIVPFVGLLAERPAIAPSPYEIAEVLEHTVARLAEVEREQQYEHELGTWVGFAYEVDGHTIWGATGRILHGFLELVRKEAPWVTATT
jgi:8-oxo-dGTP pyrophosphatase MutT (NUDIX family)